MSRVDGLRAAGRARAQCVRNTLTASVRGLPVIKTLSRMLGRSRAARMPKTSWYIWRYTPQNFPGPLLLD